MNQMIKIAATIAAGTAILIWSMPAFGCPEPHASFQLDGLTVPATVAGAMYRNCENEPFDDPPQFTLRDADSGDEIAISWDHRNHGMYEITFEESLEEHWAYEFTADPECPTVDGSQERTWSFDTGEEAAMPDVLGSWIPSNPRQGRVRFPGADDQPCTVEGSAAYIELDFQPADDADPWGRAIAFQTYVNQEVWEPQLGVGETVPAGASRLGWGKEEVYAVCDEIKPQPKPHAEILDRWVNIEIAARMPGTDLVWLSEAEIVILDCPDEEEEGEEQEENQEQEEDEEEEEELELVDDDESSCSTTGTGSSFGVLLLALCFLGVRFRKRKA